LHVDHLRVVLRDVDDLRVGREDLDDALLHDHLLLRGGLQVALGIGPGALRLHRLHHIRLLGQHGAAQLVGPIEVFVHHVDHVRVVRQCFHVGVPILRIDLALILAVAQKTGGQDDIGGHGRGRQNQRHNRVGIKRNRADQRIQFIGGQFWQSRGRGIWSRLRRLSPGGGRTNGQGEREGQHAGEGGVEEVGGAIHHRGESLPAWVGFIRLA